MTAFLRFREHGADETGFGINSRIETGFRSK